jgi:hypothetical protein
MAADRVARIHAIVNTTAVSALMLKAARAMDGNARYVLLCDHEM